MKSILLRCALASGLVAVTAGPLAAQTTPGTGTAPRTGTQPPTGTQQPAGSPNSWDNRSNNSLDTPRSGVQPTTPSTTTPGSQTNPGTTMPGSRTNPGTNAPGTIDPRTGQPVPPNSANPDGSPRVNPTSPTGTTPSGTTNPPTGVMSSQGVPMQSPGRPDQAGSQQQSGSLQQPAFRDQYNAGAYVGQENLSIDDPRYGQMMTSEQIHLQVDTDARRYEQSFNAGANMREMYTTPRVENRIIQPMLVAGKPVTIRLRNDSDASFRFATGDMVGAVPPGEDVELTVPSGTQVRFGGADKADGMLITLDAFHDDKWVGVKSLKRAISRGAGEQPMAGIASR